MVAFSFYLHLTKNRELLSELRNFLMVRPPRSWKSCCRKPGGLNYATSRNRTLAVGNRIESEIREEIDHSRVGVRFVPSLQ